MNTDWEAKRRAALDDPRSVWELIDIALSEEDEHAAWQPINVLHHRGNRETFVAARELCESDDPRKQTWGIRILATLGIPERCFPDESLSILIPLLERESDNDRIQEIAFALGHLEDARAVGPLARFKDHPNPDVRYSVVHGLLRREDDLAIRTLIELSVDEDSGVRDWATFGLGTQADADTLAIREALFDRLSDEDEDTRGEALLGLANRRDSRIIEPLLQELSGALVREHPSTLAASLVVQAAREIGDPCLCPALIALREWWGQDDELLEEAIERCKDNAG